MEASGRQAPQYGKREVCRIGGLGLGKILCEILKFGT